MGDDSRRAPSGRDAPDADGAPEADDASASGPQATDDDADGGVGRRRLIRWIAVLAFGVPVVIEGVTFGRLFVERLLDDDGDGGGVGVGDEVLSSTATTGTVLASTVRGTGADRTYVLRVAVENDTDATVELRLAAARLADGTTVESVSSTGRIAPGERGEVTGVWALGADGDPESVRAVLLRDGRVVEETTVPLATGRT